jgi:hypothetical protein
LDKYKKIIVYTTLGSGVGKIKERYEKLRSSAVEDLVVK